MHIIGHEKIFLLIKLEITIVTTYVDTSTNWTNQVLHLVLHHLNPASLDNKITKQRQAWEEHKVLERDKGMQTQVQAN